MKRIKFDESNRSGNILHIETVGCVVNIRIGLQSMIGEKVTSVEIIPDHNAEEKWKLDGCNNNRIIKG